MKKLPKRISWVLVAGFLLVAGGWAYKNMVLIKSPGFQVAYRIGESDFEDARVFHKWGDNENLFCSVKFPIQ